MCVGSGGWGGGVSNDDHVVCNRRNGDWGVGVSNDDHVCCRRPVTRGGGRGV